MPIIFGYFLLSHIFTHAVFGIPNIQQFNWNGLDVYWLEDKTFPKFTMTLYFADGALGDTGKQQGLTNTMFDLLQSGGKNWNQQQMADWMDRYAFSMDVSVGHEFSSVVMEGLNKELDASIDLVCKIFNEATFPESELKNYQQRSIAKLSNLSANQAGLTDRAFQMSLYAGTPFANAIDGTMQSLAMIKASDLASEWTRFKQSVKKKLFIVGSSDILKVKNKLINQCGLSFKTNTDRTAEIREQKRLFTWSNEGKTIFVEVPQANQVQIRIGHVLAFDEYASDFDLPVLSTGLLGSGFSSLLMQEVRVKKGLTYSIGSAARQRALFGQSMISTFTKNETWQQTLDTIATTIGYAQTDWNDVELLENTKRFLIGKQLFQFDDSEKFIATVVLYNHLGRSVADIGNFPDKIKKFNIDIVKENIRRLYPWDRMTTVLVGDKKLLKEIKKNIKSDRLVIKSYKDFL